MERISDDYSAADLSKNGGICMITGQAPNASDCDRLNEQRCMFPMGKCKEVCSVGNDQIYNFNRLNRIRKVAPNDDAAV